MEWAYSRDSLPSETVLYTYDTANAASNRGAVSVIIPAFGLLSLYDLYFPTTSLPLLPLAGASVLALVFLAHCLFRPGVLRVTRDTAFTAVVLLVLVWLSAFLGVMQGHSFITKTPLGLTAGIGMFLSVLVCGTRCSVIRAINTIAITHVAFVFFQVIFLLTRGQYLDYVALVTGTESRYLYSTGIDLTRVTGLFAEPAALSTFMYMLLVVRAVESRWQLRRLDYFLIATIVLSLSVYGLFLLVTFLFLFFVQKRNLNIKTFPTFLLALGSALLIWQMLPMWQANTHAYLVSRISHPFSDPSGAGRLLAGWEAFQNLSLVQQLAGLGSGTGDELIGRTNGVYFLLQKLGVVMAAVWLVVFGLILKRGGLGAREITAVFVTLLGAPLWTNLFWWVWLGVLMLLGSRQIRLRRYAPRRVINPAESAVTELREP